MDIFKIIATRRAFIDAKNKIFKVNEFRVGIKIDNYEYLEEDRHTALCVKNNDDYYDLETGKRIYPFLPKTQVYAFKIYFNNKVPVLNPKKEDIYKAIAILDALNLNYTSLDSNIATYTRKKKQY